ncbi:hypothetical protein [Nocardia sp. NPDC004860]|uniref:hypothetical protein n=1 Tax=Nocardia sp. NPDC004860 TaxID=3154557 RepID=UPI0033B7AA33
MNTDVGLDPSATVPPPMPISDMLWIIRVMLIGSAVLGAVLAVAAVFVLYRHVFGAQVHKLPARTRNGYVGWLAGGMALVAAAPVVWAVVPL